MFWPTNDFSKILKALEEEFMLAVEVERFIDENFDDETKALADEIEFL